jgi:Glycosyltransferase family 87
VVLMWRNLRTGGKANWWAGISLALGLIKPQLLVLFLFYLLYKRNWRALAGFTISSAAVYLVTALVSGFDWPFVYFNILSWINSQNDRYSMHPDRMYTWRGLLARFNLNDPLLLGTLVVITVAALVYAWWRSDQRVPDQPMANVTNLDLQLAATVAATVLTSLYLYTHDLTALLFSGAVLLGWAAQRAWPGWITAVLLLNLLAALTIFFGQPTDALFVAAIAAAFVALLYLLIRPQTAPQSAAEGIAHSPISASLH